MKNLDNSIFSSNLTYLLQSSNSSEYPMLTSWILNNTESISSAIALITLFILSITIVTKAELKNREIRRIESKKRILARQTKLANDLDKILLDIEQSESFIKRLKEPDRQKFKDFIIKSREFQQTSEEIKIKETEDLYYQEDNL